MNYNIMEFKILPATPDDAEYISKIVLKAIGDEIKEKMAGNKERIPLVETLFTRLAADSKSQYSYKNALIAFTSEGERAGGVVGYAGKDLRSLRKSFIREANILLGWNLSEDDFTDETSADEYYLDSLMVSDEYRHQGLATKLIELMRYKAVENHLPLGLLVDPDNEEAKKLYHKLGFRKVGHRHFAGVEMEHLQINDTKFI